jgi:hypothetical protein
VDLKLLLHLNLWVLVLHLVQVVQPIQRHRHPIQLGGPLILQLYVTLMW